MHTDRLELRPWTPHAIIAAMAGPSVLGVALGTRVSPEWPNRDFGAALPLLAEDLIALGEHGLSGLIVLRGAVPVVIGEIGCKGFPGDDGAVEIGYGVVPSHRKRGLATEAVTFFAHGLLRETPVAAVRAEVEAGNLASQRVLAKVGFKKAAVAGPGPHLWFELTRALLPR